MKSKLIVAILFTALFAQQASAGSVIITNVGNNGQGGNSTYFPLPSWVNCAMMSNIPPGSFCRDGALITNPKDPVTQAPAEAAVNPATGVVTAVVVLGKVPVGPAAKAAATVKKIQ